MNDRGKMGENFRNRLRDGGDVRYIAATAPYVVPEYVEEEE